jgi:hypothetical protein
MHKGLSGLIIVLSLSFVPMAFAQTTTSDSTSQSGASSSSGNEVGSSSLRANTSSAGGSGSAVINETYNTVAGDPSLGSAANPATSTTNVHYSGTQTINDVPAQASLIETPTAPCMVPIGGTISLAGFGGGAEGAYTSQTCETLERVRMTWNMNQQDVAYQMMCQFADYRAARATVGKPCPATVDDPPPAVTHASDPAKPASTTAPAVQAPVVQQVNMVVATSRPVDPPPPPSALAQFCASLDPNNRADAPYLATECAH